MSQDNAPQRPWYAGVTRYQWTVLVVASLGWVFDVFEGQIFVASMYDAMPSLVGAATGSGTIAFYNNVALGAFLLGGALGGVLFGAMSDRVGRKRTMTWTIVMYSLFTCVSAFSQQWWHLAAFRFLVAMGVGGEWAVASALVAEVFPQRARAWSLGIFHASSVLGTYLATAVGVLVIANPAFHSAAHPSLPWRLGFLVGVLPALLIIWIRRSLREPEGWQQARARAGEDNTQQMGRLSELFRGELLVRTVVGVGLAAVGLATFWGAHIYGKDIMRRDTERSYLSAASAAVPTAQERTELLKPHQPAIKNREMLGMFLVTTGGGLGLLSFGPLCERIGRRAAFLFFHLGGLASSWVLFQMVEGVDVLYAVLPVFGFLTLGMHAGYAIYFPELYPTRLRGTGAGFCFNVGRVIAAPILLLNGMMRAEVSQGGFGLSLEDTATILSCLFIVGIALLPFAPETRGKELPE